ncbi:hypothetical protein Vadar_033645 [Vaccinium darrowii]|uniref:Uncharacterized protein n=1 Tax=Vaccinium darrowii TaxID=229202 RepID=A0ACB7Z082_9ERIC|nr:hypothetical protein Vadar_033645 [Vaccinium darrowii]
METSPHLHDNQNPSPNSHSTTSTTSSSSSNGLHHLQPPQTPTTPKPITPRSEPNNNNNNPYPTTFVQADTHSFKQVVQMLTGSSSSSSSKPDPPKNPIPPIRTGPKKQPSSKLYERRNSLKNFKISPLNSGFSTHEILSPSILDFPSLALSPVTPLIPDPFNRSPQCMPSLDMEAEKQAIEKKGFYLHPSPANTPRDAEPRLLPLFPVTSPRVSGSSSSS